LKGFLLLTGSLVRRLLREPLVLRSLVFPVLITAGVLLGFLAIVAVVKAPMVVAVPPGFASARLSADLAQYELRVAEFKDPANAVQWGLARAGTDGSTVWTRGPVVEGGLVERVLREQRGSRWRLDAEASRPSAGGREARDTGRRFARMLASIFALYGVVFGAGMIARDRADGSLGVEFTLPSSRMLPGLARFAAAFLVLTAFLVPSLWVLDALVGVPHIAVMCRLGVAAAAASAGIGLATMAQSGVKGGFAGPLGVALIAAFGALVTGRLVPAMAPWMPIGSLWHDGPASQGLYGWLPLGVSVLVGLFGAWRVSRMEVA
jgi:hypothetical protein